MKPFNVVAIGELLVDFTPAGFSAEGKPLYEQNPGGAPANVVAALAKWGRKTSLIAKVGNDFFGEDLTGTMRGFGVDCGLITATDVAPTTLAFVKLGADGDRSFSFYRKPGADLMMTKEDVNEGVIEASRILHFGSVSLTGGTSREATWHAVELAQENGIMVSFDPNIREHLWDSLDEARKQVEKGMHAADIVKMSAEELHFVTGINELEGASKMAAETFSISFLLITLGTSGCFYRLRDRYGLVPGFKVNAVDTTGAGDAFWASVLHQLLERNLNLSLVEEDVLEIVEISNAVGALTTLKKGAISSLPSLDQIERFLLDQCTTSMKDEV